jgi:hypothetical protein
MMAQAMAAAAGLPVSAAHDTPQELRLQLLEALAAQVGGRQHPIASCWQLTLIVLQVVGCIIKSLLRQE